MAIAADTTVSSLEAVGCDVVVDGDRLTATIPPWRPDLTDPYDLVEEVVRIVGYDRVPSVLPPAPAGRGLTRDQRLRRRVGRTLAGAGYVEVLSFPFVGAADLDRLGLDRRRRAAYRPDLANPLSSEQPAMTTTLLPGLLETAARNVGRGQSDVALFETATVTLPHEGGPAPILPVDRRPTEGELADLDKALPGPAAAPGARRRRRARALRVVGRGPRGRLAGRRGRGPRRGPCPRRGVDVRAATRAPWHPGRCARGSRRRRGARPRGRAPPQGLPGLRRPSSHRGRRGRPRRAAPAGRRRHAGAVVRVLPGGSGGRRARGVLDGHRRRGRARRCATGPASCWSRCGSSTSTRATRRVTDTSPWPSGCGSVRPTAR